MVRNLFKRVLRSPTFLWSWLWGETIKQAVQFASPRHNADLAKAAVQVAQDVASGKKTLLNDGLDSGKSALPSVTGLTRNSRLFYAFGMLFVLWSLYTLWRDAPLWQAAGTLVWAATAFMCGLRTALAGNAIRSRASVRIMDPSVWFI